MSPLLLTSQTARRLPSSPRNNLGDLTRPVDDNTKARVGRILGSVRFVGEKPIQRNPGLNKFLFYVINVCNLTSFIRHIFFI